MNSKKTIIFDVDGVLLDTVPYHFAAWKSLFEKKGIKFTFKDYLLKVNGLPRLVGIKNIMPKAPKKNLETFAAQKQNYLVDLITKKPPKPLPGVVRFLKKIQQKNFKMAAASSSKNAPLLLEKSGLNIYFHAQVSGSDFKKPKPNPEIFLLASQRLKVPPERCIVVEDSYFGILAAKKCKMKTIGLMTSNDKKIPGLADITVGSLQDSKKIIDFIESL